jgi:cyclophilin family peptidyl-prolyl cis-trans isomerase
MIPSLKSLGPVFLLAISPLAQAALEADLVTSRGTVTVVLDAEKAPMAVANLITLAQGLVSWRDAGDGAVLRQPMYDGLAFDEVSNDAGLKLAALGDADAGYQFPDEFDPSLSHEPYVLAMSNDGPNTNSGRFYFTGNLALTERDNYHTVFGKIPSATSRAVIDSILAAGPGATTMDSIAIRRTGAAALAFDEMAAPLPRVSAVNGPLAVQPGVAVDLLLAQPTVSVLQVSSSPDLFTWSPRLTSLVGIDSPASRPSVTIGDGLADKEFYQISLTRYPDLPMASGPASFANRTLTVDTLGTGTLIYYFDATGLAGTYQNIMIPGEDPFFEGDFQLRTEVPPFFGPYSFRVLLHVDGLGGAPFNLIRGGYDSVSVSAVSGRLKISLLSPTMTKVFDDEGSIVLSRP